MCWVPGRNLKPDARYRVQTKSVEWVRLQVEEKKSVVSCFSFSGSCFDEERAMTPQVTGGQKETRRVRAFLGNWAHISVMYAVGTGLQMGLPIFYTIQQI